MTRRTDLKPRRAECSGFIRGQENEWMADAAWEALSIPGGGRRRSALHRAMQRKSTIAFLMTLPLMLLIALLVLYPAFYSIHLATLNKLDGALRRVLKFPV